MLYHFDHIALIAAVLGMGTFLIFRKQLQISCLKIVCRTVLTHDTGSFQIHALSEVTRERVCVFVDTERDPRDRRSSPLRRHIEYPQSLELNHCLKTV